MRDNLVRCFLGVVYIVVAILVAIVGFDMYESHKAEIDQPIAPQSMASYNPSKAMDFSLMFGGVDRVTDLSGFDTSCVKDMSAMSSGCKLAEQDVSGFSINNNYTQEHMGR